MVRDHNVSRRTTLKLVGAAGSAALVAGCNGNGDDDDNGNGGDTYQIDPGTIELDGYASTGRASAATSTA